jgi:2-keto-3-deoxy-L-rhamnonate aldolase RhmA
VEQAQHVVSAAKYGASIKGKRSAPPARFLPGVSDSCVDPSINHMQNLNRQAAIIIQIESYEGIKNLDAILTAVGDQIDSVWLGSLDTRASMEFPAGGLWGEEKEWLDAVALYESTLKKHNKPASGLALGDPESRKKMARGRSFMVTTADMYSLMGVGMQDLGEMRGESYPAMDYSKVYKEL